MPLLLASLLGLILTSCAGTSEPPGDDDPGLPGSDTLAMSAYIDDEPWIGRDSMQVTFEPRTGTFVANYTTRDGTVLRQLTLVLYHVTGPGTYQIRDSSDGNAIYLLREDKESSLFSGYHMPTSPKVTLIRFDSTGATGSFRFDAVALSGARLGDTARIRGGRFNLR